MNIPPYFPEPIEIPGNASESRYPIRLAFIRRVLALHGVTAGVLISVAIKGDSMPVTSVQALIGALVLLAMMSAVRQIALNRSALDAAVSMMLLPPLLVALGRVFAWGEASGLHAEVLLAALGGWYGYGLLCGRDFSFVGQFGVSMLAALGSVAVLAWQRGLGFGEGLAGLALSFAVVFYLTYDFAMILKRRRPDEVLAAVCDLYRDLLNGISYSGRVVQHWRRYPLGTLSPKDGS